MVHKKGRLEVEWNSKIVSKMVLNKKMLYEKKRKLEKCKV